MDVSNYEYLRYLGIQNEIKRRKVQKKISIYHVVDLLILVLLFLGCYQFDVKQSYQNEKDMFYSFSKSLVDLFCLNVFRIFYTIGLVLFYARISVLKTLEKVDFFSRHFTGILIIVNTLKIINLEYNLINGVEPTDQYKSVFVGIVRGVIMLYSLCSSIYFYFAHIQLCTVKKRNILAKDELEKILVKELKCKKYQIFGAKGGSNLQETDASSMNNDSTPTDCKSMPYWNQPYSKLSDSDDVFKSTKKQKSWCKKKVAQMGNTFGEKNVKEALLKKKNYLPYKKIEGGSVSVNGGGSDGKNGTSSGSTLPPTSNTNSNISFLEDKLTYKEFSNILLPYLWPSRRVDQKGNSLILRTYVVMIFLLIVLSKVFSVVCPIYLGLASNEVLNKDMKKSLFYLIMYVSFFFISKFLKEICGILYSQVQQSAFIELQESIFQKFHNLSYEWFSTKNAGGIMRIVDRGTESANGLMNSLLMYIIPATIEGIVTCIIFVIKYKNSLLGSVLYMGLTLYIYATIKITQWRKKIRNKANKMDNVYHDIAHDSLSNYENVKYFSNENYEIKRFCSALSNYNRYNLKILNSLGVLNSIQQFILNGTLFFTLFCAIRMIVNDGADSGTFISVIVYTSNVFAPLSILGTLYANIVKSFTDISDLTDILREKVDMAEDSDLEAFTLTSHEKKFGVSIQFVDVNFHYPSQPMHMALKDVNIYIQPGTTCAIVGHTGSGKTTISKLLYRFYDAEGEIKIGGRNVTEYTRNSVRNIIGIVPQDTILFNETIRYNVLYGKLDATEEQLVEAVKSAQLYDFIMSLPKKWDTLVGDKGVKLSGGERQRIAIARCLLKDPKIVIFDEATSSLDSKTEYLFQKAVEDLRKNRTLIIIAHRLSTISSAELIVLLNKGRIVERGTHQHLLKLNGEYTEMWNMQSRSNDLFTDDNFSNDDNRSDPAFTGQRAAGNTERGSGRAGRASSARSAFSGSGEQEDNYRSRKKGNEHLDMKSIIKEAARGAILASRASRTDRTSKTKGSKASSRCSFSNTARSVASAGGSDVNRVASMNNMSGIANIRDSTNDRSIFSPINENVNNVHASVNENYSSIYETKKDNMASIFRGSEASNDTVHSSCGDDSMKSGSVQGGSVRGGSVPNGSVRGGSVQSGRRSDRGSAHSGRQSDTASSIKVNDTEHLRNELDSMRSSNGHIDVASVSVGEVNAEQVSVGTVSGGNGAVDGGEHMAMESVTSEHITVDRGDHNGAPDNSAYSRLHSGNSQVDNDPSLNCYNSSSTNNDLDVRGEENNINNDSNTFSGSGSNDNNISTNDLDNQDYNNGFHVEYQVDVNGPANMHNEGSTYDRAVANEQVNMDVIDSTAVDESTTNNAAITTNDPPVSYDYNTTAVDYDYSCDNGVDNDDY
ncbi:multidrug resistance protein 2, putative [Plasmodium knowlesi strain H]|uniref:Multidrug resistance protein 2, putative n=3 Tax=Plasmodium knowlesi TaxID=5850 RepID=A0A5K1TW80_PLAKH|nr:ABC transporter B family member 2, putative [Plasmodium knowlesi strain H]OTN65660.1 putative Multidrug resistance protein 2 [Plasmodium knowlesi]CAA9989670.1 ABC transporter B family member 2, putative [Plasmodium knowlesi strain H]SBO22798.1 multidrug resistance protein 2, putative [Plasmodium knowlesi strain H]SBO23104.1 multidrug resistance protein 2, putative [Plasmodium knowlesi strain H]VVS79144.1 ABC transporter B family member 2, putative [Plasmodium knowlesi strain H]|eukprot:XP_002260394.1 multidrug resistance protein 2, putative [Plasmodium knowlesi strain H]